MALTYTFSTTATLAGARNLNRVSRTHAQEDLGGKLQTVISAVNLINALLVSANLSAVGFSAISGAFPSTISNFRS